MVHYIEVDYSRGNPVNQSLQVMLSSVLFAHFCNLVGLANLIVTALKNHAARHSYSAAHVNAYFLQLNTGVRVLILLFTLLGLDYKFDDVSPGKVFNGGYVMAGIWFFIGVIFLMPTGDYIGVVFISLLLILVEWMYFINIIKRYYHHKT